MNSPCVRVQLLISFNLHADCEMEINSCSHWYLAATSFRESSTNTHLRNAFNSFRSTQTNSNTSNSSSLHETSRLLQYGTYLVTHGAVPFQKIKLVRNSEHASTLTPKNTTQSNDYTKPKSNIPNVVFPFSTSILTSTISAGPTKQNRPALSIRLIVYLEPKWLR